MWFTLFLSLWAALVGLLTITHKRVNGSHWWQDRTFGPVMWTTGMPMLGLIAAAAAYLLMRMAG